MIYGATFEPLSESEIGRFGLETGYKITRLDPGLLKNAGVKEGFILVAVDRQQVRSLNDLKSALKSGRGGVLIEGVYPNGLRAYYGIGL
jgi:serine protease Do